MVDLGNRFINELRYLAEMRIIMSGPSYPRWKSIYDMDHEELNLFKKEVKEWLK